MPFYFRMPLSFESKRVKKYEAKIVTEFDGTLAVAEPDRQALTDAVHEYFPERPTESLPITVIPIAVDTQHIRPIKRQTSSLTFYNGHTLLSA